ncbi:MAG: hypothetical protein Q8O37_07360 [Sulfuricellaceae bacterium]|nr:hypothetical protein [Sulfuricellaceae bacterium]
MSDEAHPPAFSSREIRLWWPLPLAVIIWLVLVWKFGAFLSAPKVETAAPAPMEARFVELPEAAPRKSPDVQSKPLPRQSEPSIKPRPKTLNRPDPVPVQAEVPVAPADPEPTPNSSQPTDMMSYVNAAKARRRAAEMAAGQENAEAAARERGPSEDEIRMANIMRNLQPQGTNGIFQIVSMGTRNAKYSFRGWTKGGRNNRHELIEVSAGPNGDIKREIVRSMIAQIRKYYDGDFNWESPRLGRVIVQSARPEDNAGLEDFLMREFFAAGAL